MSYVCSCTMLNVLGVMAVVCPLGGWTDRCMDGLDSWTAKVM